MSAKTADHIATAVIIAVSGIIVLLLAGLLGYILFRGLPHISFHFLTSAPQTIKAGGGIGPQLFNSLFLLVLTLIITIPLGLGAGIYMSEYAKPGKLTDSIRLIVEVLSSVSFHRRRLVRLARDRELCSDSVSRCSPARWR